MEEQPIEPQMPDSGWRYSPEPNNATVIVARPAENTVLWTASEYVARHKSSSWFVLLGASASFVAALTYLLTKDVVSTFTVLVVAGLLAAVAGRKPRTLQYRIDDNGIVIGGKQYPYGLFKSYSLLPEGSLNSIVLMPIKRFQPPLSVYFDPQDQDNILNILGSHLPYEQRKADAVDHLMRKIRF